MDHQLVVERGQLGAQHYISFVARFEFNNASRTFKPPDAFHDMPSGWKGAHHRRFAEVATVDDDAAHGVHYDAERCWCRFGSPWGGRWRGAVPVPAPAGVRAGVYEAFGFIYLGAGIARDRGGRYRPSVGLRRPRGGDDALGLTEGRGAP